MADKNTLGARIIDRSIRPLFPDGYSHDVQVAWRRPARRCRLQTLLYVTLCMLYLMQVVATLLSYDAACEPEAVSRHCDFQNATSGCTRVHAAPTTPTGRITRARQ